MITAQNWRKYIEKLAAIDKRAADLMQAYINENGLEDETALINYAYALTTKYGETSATLACEMYDYMADLMGAGVPEAIPAATATYKEVARGTMWGKYHSPSQIPAIVSRQVRQAGADTMIQNAKRDNAEWAWVPQGDTCAFCITLASRGWQKASKTVLRGNHAEHIHQNCDCTFAIAFKPADRKKYDYIYDPDRYKEMYYGAGGDINALRRRIYQDKKDLINEQRRDAYQARNLFRESVNLLIPKSVGATGKNYNVKLPGTKEHAKLKEGQNITGHPFMGKDTDTVLNDRFWLEANYHVPADEWQKVSGNGIVIVHGEERFAELHWYQADEEIYDMKVKRWLDEG